jgi:hypothetical protein
MNSIKKLLLKFSFVLALILLLFSFKDEKDSLHGRVFNSSMSETRNGVVKRKVISDRIYFKNGKLKSDFLRSKYGFKWIRYRINIDSNYVDLTGADVRLLVVEASATDETNQTVIMNFTTLEWDIDGEIKITKNDRLRHKYAMAGREKHGKPKKVKKKKSEDEKEHRLFEVVMP